MKDKIFRTSLKFKYKYYDLTRLRDDYSCNTFVIFQMQMVRDGVTESSGKGRKRRELPILSPPEFLEIQINALYVFDSGD